MRSSQMGKSVEKGPTHPWVVVVEVGGGRRAIGRLRMCVCACVRLSLSLTLTLYASGELGLGHSDNAMVVVRIMLMVMVRLTDRLPLFLKV